jgi:hypothetical protein
VPAGRRSDTNLPIVDSKNRHSVNSFYFDLSVGLIESHSFNQASIDPEIDGAHRLSSPSLSRYDPVAKRLPTTKILEQISLPPAQCVGVDQLAGSDDSEILLRLRDGFGSDGISVPFVASKSTQDVSCGLGVVGHDRIRIRINKRIPVQSGNERSSSHRQRDIPNQYTTIHDKPHKVVVANNGSLGY